MISVHSCPQGRLGGKDTGGMNVYIREVAQELAGRGHTVDIYTRTHEGQHEPMTALNTSVHLIHVEDGADRQIPKVGLYSYLQRFTCGVENFRAANGFKYDLVHSHYWLSGLAGKQLKAWWRVPHIAMFHTLGTAKNRIRPGEETELRIESEREVVSDCARVVAATTREKEELISHYGASPENIAIIPCGVNLDLFQHIDRSVAREALSLGDEQIILYVGRTDPLKGPLLLLKAFACMDNSERRKVMFVGGDEDSGSELEALQSAAGALGIQDQVCFLGPVEHRRLPYYYSAADVCVIPSYYESFGLVALESLACGTPVVATDVGGMRLVIRHPMMGYITENISHHSLSEGIAELLSLRENDGYYADARRSMVSKFSWSNITESLLGEYGQILVDDRDGISS